MANNITPDAIEDEKKPQVSKEGTFNAKNYLNTRLDDNEETKEIRIRLLTIDKDSSAPFQHIFMHNVKVPKTISKSGFKNYICLEKTGGAFSTKLGHKCPFCELRRDAYNKSKEVNTDIEKAHYQKISCANIPNEVSILRCIERGHEEDGPKFWKFNLRQDKTDPESLIKGIYYTRKKESIDDAMSENGGVLPEGFVPDNILDIETGKDLQITISRVRDKAGVDTGRVSYKIVDAGKEKPLSKDPELVDKWINDPKVWSDVFVAKPYEFLDVILQGEEPWFDRNQNKWVSKRSFEESRDNSNASIIAEEEIYKAE